LRGARSARPLGVSSEFIEGVISVLAGVAAEG
jgi:hypothetical protein